MSLLRRVIAFAVLAGCVWTFQESRRGTFGMVGGAFAIMAVIIGILALAAAIFNLKVFGDRQWEDSGFDNSVLGQRSGRVFGVFLAVIFGGAPIFIAIRGLARGVIPPLWSAPDLVAARSPMMFVLCVALWLSIGMALFVLIIKGTWLAKFGGEKTSAPASTPRRRR
ncbi:hypothetical protein [Mitsuaria sp. 7]|uniref:hypothetical protein n=1 Tax=Mitsuaria sp. 7 TaxID=1658665 RepID=UPI0007DD4E33|nr:hypothetical protein [Mitsuaria sp. 7]ANH67311.1 hypothetical protein ABE85_06560 [Mitsuaria sp. 7]